MWMSSMTSDVKMPLRPSTCLLESPSSIDPPRGLEDELPLARLEAVVVPELPAAGELAERCGRLEAVHGQLAAEQLVVGRVQLRLDAVDAEAGDLAGDVDRAVVHGVAEALAGVAEDDLPAALHHEPGQQPGVAADQDGAALLVDAGPGADVTPDDEVAAAQGRAGQRPGVALDHHHAGHHVLAGRPPDPA